MSKTEERKMWMSFGKEWLFVQMAVASIKSKKRLTLIQKQNLIVKMIKQKGYSVKLKSKTAK